MRMEIEDEVVVFDDADSAVYTDEVPEDAIIEDGVSSDSIDTGEALIVNLGGKVNEVLVNGESVVENKVARITLSKVGQTNDYNDLDNKPDVDAIKDNLNETKEQLDLVIKGQTSDSLAIVGLQSDVLTLKADVAKIDLSNTEIDAKVGELEANVSDLQDQIAESGGTTVKVGGVAVDEFNADTKADASTVEQLETDVSSLDASVKSLGENVSQQGTKVTELNTQLGNLVSQVAMDYYNKTDADGKFATKDQMASQDNTTLQSANSYTDTKIADLVDTAPETLDTLGEVAKAIKDNQDVVNALNSAIGNKVDKTVKINGHSLTQNIVLTAEDVGALSDIPDGYVTTDTLNSAMEKKVDKVDGKGLSTNDYTTADKEKLAGLSNYNDSALSNRITGVENNKANKGTLSNTNLQGSIQAGIYLVDLETCTGLPDNIDDEEIYGGLGTLIASEKGRVLITTNGAEFFSKMYFMGYSENEGLFVNWASVGDADYVPIDTDNVRIGNGSTTSNLGVAIGKNATIGEDVLDSVAVGPTINNTLSNSVSVGVNIENNSWKGVAIGYNLQTSGNNSIVIGNHITNTDKANIAIGGGNTVSGEGHVAIGLNSKVSGDLCGVAVGNGSTVGANYAIQLGVGTNNTANTLQIAGDNIYNHETHTLSVQEGHFTKIYLE